MTDRYWILDGKTTKAVASLEEWARSFEATRRHVGDDIFGRPYGDEFREEVRVSTVFLGIDHNYSDRGPPLLFETMIFGGPHNDYQERYATWDEAERGHAKAVALVRAK